LGHAGRVDHRLSQGLSVIVYFVGHGKMEVEPRQVIMMNEACYFLEGRNGAYRKSRNYGGQRVFETFEEARQFIIQRENERIQFHLERIEYHKQRLEQI
jgi:hypothetical protein